MVQDTAFKYSVQSGMPFAEYFPIHQPMLRPPYYNQLPPVDLCELL
jgi:hypothetical protein